MRVVAFVPIRLNSKRVVGKNIKLLGSKPLLTYIFETLQDVDGIDEIYAFCSSEEIIPFLPNNINFLKRDSQLDQDETLGYEIYDAFIKEVDSDIYILAHTTSPFIEAGSVEKSLAKILSGEFDSALSVRRHQTFAWYKGETLNYSLESVPRTQDIEPVFTETSAFFIFSRETWMKKRRRIGDKPYLYELGLVEGIDIDNVEDFALAEILISKMK
jgi:CMP-N-acetylneuraminic acid synthetase